MEFQVSTKALQTLPFSFGFRAISHYVVRVTSMNGALQRAWVQSNAWVVESAIPTVPLHKVPPPKESMKEVEENRA